VAEGGNGGGTAAAAEPQPAGQGAHQPSDISHHPSDISPCAQLMNDSYEARMAKDKLHLNQLAFFLSPELAKRTETVQSLRLTAERASERAKMLTEMGGKQDEIAEYAEQAKVATEAYESIYADVDEELAVLHKRLYLDLPFVEKVKRKYDIESVKYITRPYYEKVKKESPEIDVRIRTIIEQENPEYAAKMKAEQAKKEELQQLHRYIMRTDKPASDERVKTMTERIERVRQLAGDEVADSYLPVLEKTKEENRKRNEERRPTPDPSLKERGVDTPADGAADEKKPKKTSKAAAKQSTKQSSKKSTKQESKKKGAK
jgi:hypothetical protein